MGYGAYLLPDGREAGYLVEAVCDKAGCETKIDRGVGYLCGQNPEGWRDAEEPGCGNYYCETHRYGEHDCTNQSCDMYSAEGSLCCGLVEGHDLPHLDASDGTKFSETEDDLELAGENPQVIDLGEEGELWFVTRTTDAHSAEEAVHNHWTETLDKADFDDMHGDYVPGELGIEYRTDWAWKHPEGWPPDREPEDDSRLVCGDESKDLPRFAGFMVTL